MKGHVIFSLLPLAAPLRRASAFAPPYAPTVVATHARRSRMTGDAYERLSVGSSLRSRSTRLCVTADPLAKEGDWTAYLDESTGLIYYFNGETGDSLWEPPTDTFPPIVLSPEKKELIREKRKQYEAAAPSPKGFLAGMFGGGGGLQSGGGAQFEGAESALERNGAAQATKEMEMEPLAKEGDWTAYLDENTGLIYYFNEDSGDSLWEPPTDTFPPIVLNAEKKELIKKKRRQYESLAPDPGAFFAGMFGGIGGGGGTAAAAPEEEAATEEETPSETDAVKINGLKRGGGFSFAGVFGETDVSVKESTPVEEMAEEEEEFEVVEDVGAYAGDYMSEVEEEMVEEKAAPPKPITPFSFPDLGISFAPKPKEKDLIVPSETPIQIEIASTVMPHPEKVSWGGEDAVFTRGRSFGVFDGVSGADKVDGVALYSKTLSNQMMKVGMGGLTIDEISAALTEAAEFADAEATGASTAVIASIGEDGFLRALNLGDSVLVVVRDGRVVAKTKEIVHYFDCPYQLGDDSPDRPKDGTELKVEVFPGDLILAGSDGVFDNLSDEKICDAISSVSVSASVKIIANQVARLSRTVSIDTEAETPYAKLAKGRRDYDEYKSGKGGKVDDISCVVVRCR